LNKNNYFTPSIHILLEPIYNGRVRVVKTLLKKRDYRPYIKLIDFKLMVSKILKRYDHKLFKIVMNHFRPPLYSFLVSSQIVDPFIFYLAMEWKNLKFINACMAKAGLSDLVSNNSIETHDHLLPILESQHGIKARNIRYISKHKNSYLILLKDWDIRKISINDLIN